MRREAQPSLSEEGQQALAHYAYVLQQAEDLSAVTLRNYLSDLRQFIAWCESSWHEVQEDRSFTPQNVAPPLLIRYRSYLATLSPECQYLFPSEKTQRPLTGRALGHLITKYARAAHIADVSPDDLRHLRLSDGRGGSSPPACPGHGT